MDLKALENKDLEKLALQIIEEKNRRLDKERREKLDRLNVWVSTLTRPAIDIMVPEHGRTSCSDTNTINGWGSRENSIRCTRCFLLNLLDSGVYYPTTPCTISVSVQFDPPSNP